MSITRKTYSVAMAGALAACFAFPAAAGDLLERPEQTTATAAAYPTPVPRSQVQPVVVHDPKVARQGAVTAVPASIRRAPQGKIGSAPQLQLLRNEFITGGQNGKAAIQKNKQGGAR